MITVLILAGVVTSVALAQQEPAAAPMEFLCEDVSTYDLQLGQEIYAASCVSCHGADLKYQPDWKRRGENGRMPAACPLSTTRPGSARRGRPVPWS